MDNETFKFTSVPITTTDDTTITTIPAYSDNFTITTDGTVGVGPNMGNIVFTDPPFEPPFDFKKAFEILLARMTEMEEKLDNVATKRNK